jgi:hypothetical protein
MCPLPPTPHVGIETSIIGSRMCVIGEEVVMTGRFADMMMYQSVVDV